MGKQSAARLAASRKYKAKQFEFVRAYKLAAGCADCGYNAHPDALEFDHIPGRGEKKHNMNKCTVGMKGKDAILREIAKCDVVCANCHRVRTAIRREESML